MAPVPAALLQAQLPPQSPWQLPEKLSCQLLAGQGLEIVAHEPPWSLTLTLHDLHDTMLLQMYSSERHPTEQSLLRNLFFYWLDHLQDEQMYVCLVGCQTL